LFYIFAVIVNVEKRIILGIESSCDDTSASVIYDRKVLSNVTASQSIHEKYGGVVPELASRAHQQNILPIVDTAIKEAEILKTSIDAVAVTCGPGLVGSLLVGLSFAKSFSLAMGIPLLAVNHLYAHVLAHFIDNENRKKPKFPFLCLTVSGGHTQIVLVRNYLDMEVIGSTIDDAAGEAFDKSAKMLGLPYPGGQLIDKYAKEGDPKRFKFSRPQVKGYNYSFSGLKTSILYFLQKQTDSNFIEKNRNDLCASIQQTIIEILLSKLVLASKELNISEIAIAGGVSANSGLRQALQNMETEKGWRVFVPEKEYCTDNGAMIAIAGHFLYEQKQFAKQDIIAKGRFPI